MLAAHPGASLFCGDVPFGFMIDDLSQVFDRTSDEKTVASSHPRDSYKEIHLAPSGEAHYSGRRRACGNGQRRAKPDSHSRQSQADNTRGNANGYATGARPRADSEAGNIV
jgi:hypothetical protein